jgi:hypothetical protein
VSARLFAALLVLSAGRAVAAEPTSCVICHSDEERTGSLRIVELYREGVHAEVGLACHDCHGGNPDPALAADPEAAMDPSFGPSPFVGAPERREVPGFCGRCHSDPVVMRRFDPGARVDQEREYWTSHHGIALEQGDPRVATCIDCHGAHGILRSDDPDAPIYPTRVAETCAGCHADPTTMEGYIARDGRPLPVDQYALWRRSVHAAALLEREDLSAPTCNDCHGNHGATPPDVNSVAQMCGRCHGREGQLFRNSLKSEGFARHNAFLADAGEEGCAACHAEPEPQAELRGIHSLGECVACHGNHGVVRPTVAMLSPLPDTPCAFCHEAPNPELEPLIASEVAEKHYLRVRDEFLSTAAGLGLEGAERFDWLVDQALSLPFHTLPAGEAGETGGLRPEFERLYLKFRIGKTRLPGQGPAGGGDVVVVRCGTCHAPEPLLAEQPQGLRVAGEFLERMRELTVLTASSERTVLRARRGGVDTSRALLEIDASVDAQVELEVLVHGFAVGPESEFIRKQEAGMEHASAALTLAREALDELAFRRRGLFGFLVVVAFVLVALALKIRQTSARVRHERDAAG